jgi:CheY-like chemotaxis protein
VAFQNVLVVDDEESMRHLLTVILTDRGYDVRAVSNGEDALRELSVRDYDLVLSDVRMPRMDGLSLLRKALDLHPDITFIVMSAYGTHDTAIEAMKAGAYDYVSKPFKPDEVLLVLRKAEERVLTLGMVNTKLMVMDCAKLDFPDDSFDVVISWAAVEHFAGGYLQALREMKRVLRPDGLLFIHPGLYYCNAGHHLAEYSREPFFHLRKSRDEIRATVFSAKPTYEDRAGETPTPAQHWQWFNELNPITVTRFEQELRALEFEPRAVQAARQTAELVNLSRTALGSATDNAGAPDSSPVVASAPSTTVSKR